MTDVVYDSSANKIVAFKLVYHSRSKILLGSFCYWQGMLFDHFPFSIRVSEIIYYSRKRYCLSKSYFSGLCEKSIYLASDDGWTCSAYQLIIFCV